MRRFFSSWQGFIAGLISLGLFLSSPAIVRAYDPTSGTFDGGYLQWIILSTCLFFCGIFMTWAGWQIAFKSMDKAADGKLSNWFWELSPREKVIGVQLTFVIVLIYWCFCLVVVPL